MVHRTLPLAVVLALGACLLSSCDDADKGDVDRATERMSRLRWGADDTFDTCARWVVRSGAAEKVEVLDTSDGTTVPAGLDTAGCIPTDDGPVVVGARGSQLVGLDPAGEQRWAHDGLAHPETSYDGYGAVVVPSDEPGGWTVVDAWTGDVVADARGGLTDIDGNSVDDVPLRAVGADLVTTLDAAVVRLPSRERFLEGGSVALVDGASIALQVGPRLELVRLEDRKVLWSRTDVRLPAFDVGIADPTTDVVVTRTRAGGFTGVDLTTGKIRWQSALRRSEFAPNAITVGAGVAVVPAPDGGQVVLDSATGERLPDPAGTLVVGPEFLLLVDGEGVPVPVTVDDLR